MPEPTLVEAVTGLQSDLTALHRQIDAACLEIRHLRAVNRQLVATLELIRSRAGGAQLQPHGGEGPVPEYFACVEIREWADEAIRKAGD